MSRTKMALDVVQDLRSLADSIEALANAAMDGEPEQTAPNTTPPAASQAEKPISLVELRAFVAERSTPTNRPKIKALLTKHGVSKLTELPESHYAELRREVAAL